MEARNNQSSSQFENGQTGDLSTRAINQLAIGSLILLWGSLLVLKQIGIIDESINILPFPLTLFGALLIVGGLYRLRRSWRLQETSRR